MELGPKQRLWLEKLRSGEYEQGKGILHSLDHKFCCIGVACDLFLASSCKVGDFQSFYLPHPTECYVYGAYNTAAAMPAELYEELCVHPEDQYFDVSRDLAYMNDSLGLSFAEIADKIEATPERFFYEPA